MALIQYNLKYKNGKPKVTYTVLQVDQNDRIQFESDTANTAIRYKGGTPFNGLGPQADKEFPVGNQGVVGPFMVAKTIMADQSIHFDCGEIADGKEYSAAKPGDFMPWSAGCDTPPFICQSERRGLS